MSYFGTNFSVYSLGPLVEWTTDQHNPKKMLLIPIKEQTPRVKHRSKIPTLEKRRLSVPELRSRIERIQPRKNLHCLHPKLEPISRKITTWAGVVGPRKLLPLPRVRKMRQIRDEKREAAQQVLINQLKKIMFLLISNTNIHD